MDVFCTVCGGLMTPAGINPGLYCAGCAARASAAERQRVVTDRQRLQADLAEARNRVLAAVAALREAGVRPESRTVPIVEPGRRGNLAVGQRPIEPAWFVGFVDWWGNTTFGDGRQQNALPTGVTEAGEIVLMNPTRDGRDKGGTVELVDGRRRTASARERSHVDRINGVAERLEGLLDGTFAPHAELTDREVREVHQLMKKRDELGTRLSSRTRTFGTADAPRIGRGKLTRATRKGIAEVQELTTRVAELDARIAALDPTHSARQRSSTR